ncbi:protein OCTOPUS [Brassica napus]|uniref:Uncharacterized protein n=3 Tax=Brassica TaxID=3705 RepID=A0A0D3C4X1_BRAOL|nr:PREDICTED: UPF0503 protein At3g09070, chloroplastic [Brassica oleracea var. oleracea]XP_013699433.1 protein OCTOPUS [Brassica napus]CAF1868448.1 unnamed protein product [Brassica napus]VDD15410.1 unnamed protein product [Brassica oleracea]
MNPTHNNPVAASALAPPQPHRPSTSCDRHPEERFTGFCPSCLFERLSVLDINAVASSSRKPPSSSSAAALKAIFKPSSSSSSFFPELRRTKSFSARKNEALFSLGAFEPQRRSCDVRVRNTLWSLFNEDAEHIKEGALTVKEGTLTVNREIGLETRKPKSPVFEEGIDCGKKLKDQRSVIDEIIEEEEETEEKEHMELNPQTTTAKKPTRSFWSAASVLSKKLQKWRQKQKLKKHSGGALPVEKSAVRQLRDTQSEVADYGYGRRSCDTDPRFSIDAGRFSLDAGRVSVDDPRYSFDEPRASFDGYMIGRATAAAPPRMPSMLSVVEDSPVSNLVPVEEPPPPPRTPPESVVPGGSEQTREYYNDSSSRRRKSLDRSSSTRKISASIISEIDELKLSGSNTKVSPPREREVKDSALRSHSRSHSSSVRGDCSVENLEIGTVESSKKGTKKSKRWSWNIFGMLHRKNEKRFEEGRSSVDRTFSGSWNVEARNGFDPKMMRSNSSVSWRSSTPGGGGFHRNSVDGYVSGKKKVSSSSSSIGRKVENGVLKFNLTPSKGRRTGSMDSTSRPVPPAHPLARNFMNFY